MSRRRTLLAGAAGALIALVAVGVLALVGAFDSGGDGSGGLPSVPSALGAEGGNRVHGIYEQASPGVAFIQASVEGGRAISTGTGIALDRDGHILTNAHVVENSSKVAASFEQGRPVPATVVGRDLSDDLAVLKVDPSKAELHPLALGDSRKVQVGDPVVAIGNPLGLADTITSGIVSAKQRFIRAPNGFTIENVIQTDAAVNPGNSGGPLIDLETGQVIGINSQIATAPQGGGNGFIGIAFAIPIDTAKAIVPDLEDDGKVERAFIGVTTVQVTPQVAQQLGLGVDHGALVVAVAPGSAAAGAGLQPARMSSGAMTAGGDVIVRVGKRTVASPADLANAVADLRPDDRVPVEYVRDGRHHTVTVRLTDRPS
jgi:S1-C subfamily serine protease